jgi:hypothetical protein
MFPKLSTLLRSDVSDEGVLTIFHKCKSTICLYVQNFIFTFIYGVHYAGLSDFSVSGARAAAFFSASGAALSQEVPTVK